MEFGEYLLFIPLLIYGTALAELMVQWKQSFHLKNMHWLYFLTVLAITELAVGNIYNYLGFFTRDAQHHYLSYLTYLLPPLLLHFTTITFPPSTQSQEEAFAGFTERIPRIFMILGLYIGVHLFPLFNSGALIGTGIKIAGVLICAAIVITRKELFIYSFFVLWLLSFAYKLWLL